MTGHPRNWSIERAAEELGCGRTYLYALRREGKLRVIKIGRRTLIPNSEIERLQAEGRNDWRQMPTKAQRTARQPATSNATMAAMTERLKTLHTMAVNLAVDIGLLIAEIHLESLSPHGLAKTKPQRPDPLLDAPVDELPIASRTRNCLINHNVETVRDALAHSETDLLRISGFWRGSLMDLRAALELHMGRPIQFGETRRAKP